MMSNQSHSIFHKKRNPRLHFSDVTYLDHTAYIRSTSSFILCGNIPGTKKQTNGLAGPQSGEEIGLYNYFNDTEAS
jgi:hypothetical protein